MKTQLMGDGGGSQDEQYESYVYLIEKRNGGTIKKDKQDNISRGLENNSLSAFSHQIAKTELSC